MSTSFEIHPAVGIARVGDSASPTEFNLGPEPELDPPTSFRDSSNEHRIKKQVARFRIYKCERDADNRMTSATEVKAADAQITWTVHLANRKGAAPKLEGPGTRNNATGDDSADAALINDPGPRSIGLGQSAQFDNGKFMGKTVPLGAISTDKEGRLLVFGGNGDSGPIDSGHATLNTFADNDGWFDDVSDGPVNAQIKFPSEPEPHIAEAAWVVVAPPDFAPQINNAVSWFDIAFQAGVTNRLLSASTKPSFTNDVFPILSRLVNYQWVSKKFSDQFSSRKNFDFAAIWAQLSDPRQQQQLRKSFFQALRDPANPTGAGQVPRPFLPPVHNDDDSPGVILAYTPVQYAILKNWVLGNFEDDWGRAVPTREMEPDALTRTVLQACVGGPFFPGIEAGRVIADAGNYHPKLPFRFDAGKLKPGQVTQGNAVPWQADFFACRLEGFLAWWPAQRPDTVPTPKSTTPQDWAQNVGGMEEMVTLWKKLGFLVQQATGSRPFLEQERMLDPPSPR